jgi:hypothetical protein
VLAGQASEPTDTAAAYASELAHWGLQDPDAQQVLHDRAPRQAATAGTNEVWPEHETPLSLFCAMLTQWRHGPQGHMGLDYAVLPIVERRLGIEPDAARAAFPGLQMMEDEALAWFAERASA